MLYGVVKPPVNIRDEFRTCLEAISKEVEWLKPT